MLIPIRISQTITTEYDTEYDRLQFSLTQPKPDYRKLNDVRIASIFEQADSRIRSTVFYMNDMSESQAKIAAQDIEYIMQTLMKDLFREVKLRKKWAKQAEKESRGANRK